MIPNCIKNNVLLGDEADVDTYLKAVCFDEEAKSMEDGINTIVGNSGVRLSGGQAQRLALARTLCHKKPVLILDDPFSALDRKTEEQVFQNLKAFAKDSIVMILSHRLYLFPEMNQVIWMEDGKTAVGTHESIKKAYPEYAKLYEVQTSTEARAEVEYREGGKADAQ